MIIKRLGLRNFKKFRDVAIEFGRGLNVVKGPNEAGKSTLHAALRTAFFAKPTAGGQEIRLAKSWRAEEMFAIDLDVAVDGADYRIAKDFAARKGVLSGGEEMEPLTDPDAIQARLGEWLGCPNEKFFRSTVCVGQDEVAGWDAGEMAGHLQRVVSGGDVAAQEALKQLTGALQKLRVGLDRPAANPGQIKQAKDRLVKLRELRGTVAGQVSRVAEAQKTATECGEKLEEIGTELETKTGLLDKNRKARELGSQIVALEKEFAARRRAKELDAQIASLACEEEALPAVARDERGVAALIDRQSRLDEKRRLSERMRTEAAEAPQATRPAPLIPAVGAVILVAGLVAGYTMTPGVYVMALAGAAILAFGLARYLAPGRTPARPGTSQPTTMDSEIEADAAALQMALAEAGVASVDEATSRLGELRDLRARRDQTQGELSGITGGKTWARFDEETRGLAPQIEQKKEVLASLEGSVLEPVEFERLQAEVRRLETARRECEKRLDQAHYAVVSTEVDPDELARIDDETAEILERLELLDRRRRVYEAAIEGIELAERETMETATEALQETVGVHVSEMTDGRYSVVKVGEKDLSMSVRSDEKDDWASVDADLSRATRDQFYLAARLGLIGELCGKAKPPLLLDDPFVTFDDDRLERTMALLKKMAAERQVLLFTCHDEYVRFADHVVDLGGTRKGAAG